MIPGYRPLLETAPPVTIDYAAEKAASEARRRAKIAPALEAAARVLAVELEAAKQAGKGGRPRKVGAPAPRRTPSGKIAKDTPARRCTDGSQPGCLKTLPKSSNQHVCRVCRGAQPCARCGKPKPASQKGTMHARCYRAEKYEREGIEPPYMHGTRQRYEAGCGCQRCADGETLRNRMKYQKKKPNARTYKDDRARAGDASSNVTALRPAHTSPAPRITTHARKSA